MLSDADISTLISTQNLIENFKAENLQNCSYTLTVGSIFKPDTGEEEDVPLSKRGTECKFWVLGPTECLIIKTKEKLNICNEIGAYYAPLNRMAQQGVMLLNASMIEPGYQGFLSCFLVNFSSRNIKIYPDQEIAKITFHRLDNPIAKFNPLVITEKDYEVYLSRSASGFEHSFLGINTIEDRVKKAASDSINKSLIWSGMVIGILLIISQIEPFIAKFVWEKSGVLTTSSRIEFLKMQQQLDANDKKVNELLEIAKTNEELTKLKYQLTNMRKDISNLKEDKVKNSN